MIFAFCLYSMEENNSRLHEINEHLEQYEDEDQKPVRYIPSLKNIAAKHVASKLFDKQVRENLKFLPIELLSLIMIHKDIIIAKDADFAINLNSTFLQYILDNPINSEDIISNQDHTELLEQIYQCLNVSLSFCLEMLLKCYDNISDNQTIDRQFLIKLLHLINLEILICYVKSEHLLYEFEHKLERFKEYLKERKEYVNKVNMGVNSPKPFISPVFFISIIWNRHQKIPEFKTLKLLLDNGTDINFKHPDTGQTGIFFANTKRAYLFFLENGANPNILDNEGFPAYKEYLGNPEYFPTWINIMQLLVKYNADFDAQNENGQTILMIILSKEPQNIYAIQLLLSLKADIYKYDKDNNCPLIWAFKNSDSWNRDSLSGKIIIEHAKKLETMPSDLIPIFAVIFRSRINEIQQIFANKINCRDRKGNTPLIAACSVNSTYMAEAFIDMGADIDIANNENVTALMVASEKGNDKLIKLLTGDVKEEKPSGSCLIM